MYPDSALCSPSDRSGRYGNLEMKLIWKRDPELSYVTYSPRTDGEPARVEPVRMDENGRLIFEMKEEESGFEQESDC